MPNTYTMHAQTLTHTYAYMHPHTHTHRVFMLESMHAHTETFMDAHRNISHTHAHILTEAAAFHFSAQTTWSV